MIATLRDFGLEFPERVPLFCGGKGYHTLIPMIS